MISTEKLIERARRSTNTTDINSVSLLLCQDYLNRIQSYMEDLLFLVNDENDLFLKDYEFALIPGQDQYSLPLDIYAKSSIDTVAVSFLNGLSQTFLPLKKISRKQRGFTFGYFVQEKSLLFSPRPQSPLRIKMTYQRKVPSVSCKIGTISAFTGTTITLTNYVANISSNDDFICIVDADGNILNKTTDSYGNDVYAPIRLVSDTLGALVTDVTTGAVNGAFVVSGKFASSHSQLPDECEKYLTIALERLIQYRQSSPDVKVSSVFSEEELKTINEVFADNSYDDAKPPVTEWQEWLP
jgi:hypothetical protein